jgi:hypothetical protein
MNIVIDERLIRRNRRIGLFSSFAGLLVLGIGMVISFRYQQYFGISLIALLVGFLLSQLGMYFTNRWGKNPRPDEVIDQALKGLDKRNTIYHYSSPVSHLLVGPVGVWILQPHNQTGIISYSKGRWRQRGGNWYLKIFAQEGLGRPDLEVDNETKAIQKVFREIFPEDNLPEINVALVFTNPKVEISISDEEEPPAFAVSPGKLKDLIRKISKGKSLSPEKIALIHETFQGDAG